MLSKIATKKSQVAGVLFALLFIYVGWLSFSSIRQLQGNARVINYVGIVRGATQRLVKKELQNFPDDPLITRLNSIVTELLTGKGSNNLVVLHDDVYLGNMRQVQNSWNEIKLEIEKVRAGADDAHLYELSENYFTLVDRTVSSAEAFTERQVQSSINILLGVNGLFIFLLFVGAVYYARTIALRRRAEVLNKLAYVDTLTNIPNRASCEQEMERLTSNPPAESIAILMFDMNNLKKVNDELGHTHGDKIIASFGQILLREAENFGFIGRHGGDEFIAIFCNADQEKVDHYLSLINEKIVSYNVMHINELDKISFAVGSCIGKVGENRIDDMLNEADKRMYIRKRQMKENRE